MQVIKGESIRKPVIFTSQWLSVLVACLICLRQGNGSYKDWFPCSTRRDPGWVSLEGILHPIRKSGLRTTAPNNWCSSGFSLSCSLECSIIQSMGRPTRGPTMQNLGLMPRRWERLLPSMNRKHIVVQAPQVRLRGGTPWNWEENQSLDSAGCCRPF